MVPGEIRCNNGPHQWVSSDPLDEESQNLQAISTPMGRFKYLVLAQEVCSASDIFNFLTDGTMRYDGSEFRKNMDDILLYGLSLEELQKKLEVFIG